MNLLIYSILFYGGIIFSVISVIGTFIAIVLLKTYKKRLEQILDREYGKQYHAKKQEEV